MLVVASLILWISISINVKMAVVKKLGKYSEDAILQSLSRGGVSIGDINKLLEPALKLLESQDKEKIVKPKASSAADVFTNNVLPDICKDLEEYERNILTKPVVQVSIDFAFDDNFTNMSLSQMKKMHVIIVDREDKIGTLDKYIKYVRGKLYEEAYRYIMQGEDRNEYEFFEREFGVSYRTASRYMSFALLIQKWPRLLITRITFWQLLKHSNRFQKHLKNDQDMSARLEVGVELSIQGKKIYIAKKEVAIPSIKHNIDPDAVYLEEKTKPTGAEVSDVRSCLEENINAQDEDDIDSQCASILKMELNN